MGDVHASLVLGGASVDVVGLDLSLTGTGLCTADGRTYTLGTKGVDGMARLEGIVERVVELSELRVSRSSDDHLERVHPDVVAIEGYSFSSKFRGERLAELGGIVRWHLWQRGLPFVEVSPATLKKYATGKGNATKVDMAVAAMKRAGIEFKNDNECDAWWLRQLMCDALGHAELVMPAESRLALKSIDQLPVVMRAAS